MEKLNGSEGRVQAFESKTQFYFDIILLVYIFSTEQYTFSRCNVEHNG